MSITFHTLRSNIFDLYCRLLFTRNDRRGSYRRIPRRKHAGLLWRQLIVNTAHALTGRKDIRENERWWLTRRERCFSPQVFAMLQYIQQKETLVKYVSPAVGWLTNTTNIMKTARGITSKPSSLVTLGAPMRLEWIIWFEWHPWGWGCAVGSILICISFQHHHTYQRH